jgi:hypothetical protein
LCLIIYKFSIKRESAGVLTIYMQGRIRRALAVCSGGNDIQLKYALIIGLLLVSMALSVSGCTSSSSPTASPSPSSATPTEGPSQTTAQESTLGALFSWDTIKWIDYDYHNSIGYRVNTNRPDGTIRFEFFPNETYYRKPAIMVKDTYVTKSMPEIVNITDEYFFNSTTDAYLGGFTFTYYADRRDVWQSTVSDNGYAYPFDISSRATVVTPGPARQVAVPKGTYSATPYSVTLTGTYGGKNWTDVYTFWKADTVPVPVKWTEEYTEPGWKTNTQTYELKDWS